MIKKMRTLTKELQDSITPQMALEILKDGNNRFVQNLRANRNLLQQVNETKESQHPFAIVLSCIDSRTSAELVFDQGLGDIFSVRIAGNVLNEDILGSMEFACKIAGSKIIVVLGHTKCGAIKGAIANVKMENLSHLLDKITPAIEKTKESDSHHKHHLENGIFVDAVASTNVRMVAREISKQSSILKEMLEKGEIGIVCCMYNVESGRVDFYDDEVTMFNTNEQMVVSM
jgi:carbonic anhydrase